MSLLKQTVENMEQASALEIRLSREVMFDFLKEHQQLQAKLAIAVGALAEIEKKKDFTLLCDPADYDFNAEDAYSGGANNAWCETAEIAREAVGKIGNQG